MTAETNVPRCPLGCGLAKHKGSCAAAKETLDLCARMLAGQATEAELEHRPEPQSSNPLLAKLWAASSDHFAGDVKALCEEAALEIELLQDLEARLREKLAAGETKAMPKGEERVWRVLLAFAYSGYGKLYGDDGELQDASELPHIDYMRDTPWEIEAKIFSRGARKLEAARAAEKAKENLGPEAPAGVGVIDLAGRSRCPHCHELPGVVFLHAWMRADNPMLGGITPLDMLKMGRGEKLAYFIEEAYEAEGGLLEQFVPNMTTAGWSAPDTQIEITTPVPRSATTTQGEE